MALEQPDLIVTHFNPVGYASRDALFADFLLHIVELNLPRIIVVEAAFGDNDWKFTQTDNENHVQVRSRDELWIKESLFEAGLHRCRSPYVIMCDGDVQFQDRYMVEKCVAALQRHDVIQPWSRAIYAGPQGEPLSTHESFCYSWLNENQQFPAPITAGYPQYYWHPGLCWAYNRDKLGEMGGLIDFDVLGGGDYHMAQCLVGKTENVFPDGVTENYRIKVRQWQENAAAAIHQNIGFAYGTLLHKWHGSIDSRNYGTKWDIVIKNKYDPFSMVNYNAYGVIQWSYQAPARLIRDVSSYFRIRNEDSIEVTNRFL